MYKQRTTHPTSTSVLKWAGGANDIHIPRSSNLYLCKISHSMPQGSTGLALRLPICRTRLYVTKADSILTVQSTGKICVYVQMQMRHVLASPACTAAQLPSQHFKGNSLPGRQNKSKNQKTNKKNHKKNHKKIKKIKKRSKNQKNQKKNFKKSKKKKSKKKS